MGILTGVRVIDCSEGIAGPMAMMYLADFGAEVLKVERPGGDPARKDPGFSVWNRNKVSVVLDLESTKDCERLNALLRGAQLCVFSATLTQLKEIGYDPESIAAINPGCVYLHMPSFTESGPWCEVPESAELVSALTGVSSSQYSFDGGPVDPVIPHVLYGQAIWGAAAATAALCESQHSGVGQTVTVSGAHGWLVTMTGSVTRRPGAPSIHAPGGAGGPVPFYRLYECANGEWLFLAGLTPAFHTAAFSVLGVLDELLSDPRLGGELLATALPENAPWVIERVASAFRTKTRDEWLKILREAGCPAGPVQSREAWFDHEQVRAIGMREEVRESSRGRVEMPGLPLKLSITPATIRFGAPEQAAGPVPEWPALDSEPSRTSMTGGPLAGIRVLDLGSIIAGTYAGSLLAALGADVVKVESPSGDSLRNFGPTFFGYNLGKRSLVLDLKHEEGRATFLEMVARADIVVDNYRPGVLRRLGLDYESLRPINPRIISISVTGYGEAGPLGFEPGFDPLLQAASGMMQAQGGDDEPVFFLLPVNDVASAATAALGATLALYHRDRSGEAQRVTTSLAAQSVMMQCREMVRFDGSPEPIRGGRDFRGPSVLNRLYRTADGWIRLKSGHEGFVEEGHRIGLTEMATEPDLEEAFARISTEAAVERFRDTPVLVVPVRTLAEVVIDSEFRTEGLVQRLLLGDGSETFASGTFAKFSKTPVPPPARAPGLGEHSREVLTEYGISDASITALLAHAVTLDGESLGMP